jgi:hypothetical protein
MPGPYIPFGGFSPDLDPTTPGVILACEMLVPTLIGMKGAAAPVPAQGLPPAPDVVTGAATVVLLAGTARAFAGTPTRLYEALSNSWLDVTRKASSADAPARNAADPLDAAMQAIERAAGDPIPYRGTVSNVWRFAQMGNATLAVNNADPIQQSIVSGPFADIPGSPVAAVIDVTQGFVFVANVTDPTYGQRPDGWWCSALYDQSNWVPNIATQCATARLIDTPGANTACRALGSNIVIYKASSFYYGTYQGPPLIWAFNVVSNQVGAPTQEAVISIGTAHVFLGNDNFYSYDGTRPQPIGDTVKKWFFADRNPAADYVMRSMHDQRNSLVYWFYVSMDSPDGQTIDSGIVYNYRANRWGHVAYRVEATFEHIVGQMTWDDLGTFYTTWDDLPAVSYDSPFWVNASRVPSIIDPSHVVQTLTGPSTNSALQTGEMGDDEAYSDLQYMRLRCRTDPASAVMYGLHRTSLGGSDYTTSQTTMHDGTQFDVDVSARWHSVAWAFQGDVELLGYVATMIQDGLQ